MERGGGGRDTPTRTRKGVGAPEEVDVELLGALVVRVVDNLLADLEPGAAPPPGRLVHRLHCLEGGGEVERGVVLEQQEGAVELDQRLLERAVVVAVGLPVDLQVWWRRWRV